MKTFFTKRTKEDIPKKWNNDNYYNEYTLNNFKLNYSKRNGKCFFVHKDEYIYFRVSYEIKSSKNFSFLISNLAKEKERCIKPYNTRISLYFRVEPNGIENDRFVIETVGNKNKYSHSKVNIYNDLETVYFGKINNLKNEIEKYSKMPEETKNLLYLITEKINFKNDLSFAQEIVSDYSLFKKMLKRINYNGLMDAKLKKALIKTKQTYKVKEKQSKKRNRLSILDNKNNNNLNLPELNSLQ